MSTVGRLVVVGTAGGEGASTVARLAAAAAFASGRGGGVVTRADDPGPSASPGGGDPGRAGVIIDAGPHGADGTGRPGDVAVLVCAASAAAIERARALLTADPAERAGRVFAALVITARSRPEQRRARIRMEQAAVDSRTLLLPYDPALRFGRSSQSTATVTVGERLMALLAG